MKEVMKEDMKDAMKAQRGDGPELEGEVVLLPDVLLDVVDQRRRVGLPPEARQQLRQVACGRRRSAPHA